MQTSRSIATRHSGTASQPPAFHARRSCAKPFVSHQQRLTVRRAVPELVNDSTNLAYAGIGLALASFLGTFVIIPRFKDNFREGVDYKDLFAVLKKTGVRTLTPTEAYQKARKGAVLLDVRLEDKYNELHASLCKSSPLYRPILGYDFASNLRRVGFAFFGIFGTELNPSFIEDVEASVPKGKEVVVMCDMGGSLEGGNAFGRQSRSLKAYYYLQEAGYKVSHMKGGLAQWSRDGLPLVDPDTEDEVLPEESASEGAGGVAGWFSKLLQRE